MASKKSDLARQSHLAGITASIPTIEEATPVEQQHAEPSRKEEASRPFSVSSSKEYKSERIHLLLKPNLLNELRTLAKSTTDPDLVHSNKKNKSLSVNKTIEYLVLLGLHQVAQWQGKQEEKTMINAELVEQIKEMMTKK